MNMTETNENGNGRVKSEHRMTALEIKVDTILTNHLPHLEKKIDQLTESVDKLGVSLQDIVGITKNWKAWYLGVAAVVSTFIYVVVNFDKIKAFFT